MSISWVDSLTFHANLTPSKVALVGDGIVFSYSQLAAAIGVIEHRLREAKVRNGAFIAVQFDRSLEQLVAFAATYRMGLSFAAVPAGRIDWLADLGCDLILTDKLLSYRVTGRIQSTPVLVLGDSWHRTEAAAETDPYPPRDSEIVALNSLDKWDQSNSATVITRGDLDRRVMGLARLMATASTSNRVVTSVDLNSTTGLLLAMASFMLGRTLAATGKAQAREVIATYRHEFLVATASQLEDLANAQAAIPLPLNTLESGLVLLERGVSADWVDRIQSLVCPNLHAAWSAPDFGPVTFQTARRLTDATCLGYIPPWIEAMSDDAGKIAVRSAVGPENEGGWIGTGRRGRINEDRLLFLD